MKCSNLFKLILTSILITVQSIVHSQTPRTLPYNYSFDSLVNVNEHYTKQDILKLRMLNAIAFDYPNANPAKGIETAEQAINLAQKLNNQLLLAEAFNDEGLNYFQKGDYTAAMEFYEKALIINQSLINTFGVAHNIYNIGYIYRVKGDNQKAQENYEQALKLFESISDKAGIAKSQNGLGRIYYNQSDYTKALEYYQKALAINQPLGNKVAWAFNLNNIGLVYYTLSDYPKALEYYQKALTINQQIGNKTELANNYNNIGRVCENLSDYPKALEYYQKALAINEQSGNQGGIALNYNNIGIIYRNLDNHPKALEYYQKALTINEQTDNKSGLAMNFNNIGTEYHTNFDYPNALEFYKKALAINEQSGNKAEIASNLNNIGLVYTNLSNYPKVLEYYQKALAINEQSDDKEGMALNLCNIGVLYLTAPDSFMTKIGVSTVQRYEKALQYQNKSLALAQETGALLKQAQAWSGISMTYEKQGSYDKAFAAYKQYIIFRDSVESGEVKRKIERKAMQYEFDKKETVLIFERQLTQEKLIQSQQETALEKQRLLLTNKEKDLQHLAFLKEKAEKQEKEKQLTLSEKDKQLQATQLTVLGQEKKIQKAQLVTQQKEIETKNAQRNLFIGGTILMLLLAGSIFVGLRRTAKEKKRSDTLLLNILPSEIAEELKAKGSAEAQMLDEVTVLFTDFKGFTQLSEKLTPKELVAEINECFSAFDHIMEKFGIEKIKTIGDAYMAAGGLPVPNSTHAFDVVNAALAIQKFMNDHKAKKEAEGKLFFEIRIGIHSGPVVAGIVGVKKFAYDIWGDTVNTASRMESSGEAGSVNISGTTYELVKGSFNCLHRGKIQAKGKGEIDMYFVESPI